MMDDYDPKYEPLVAVLNAAYAHAAKLKGAERHVVADESFDQQITCWISRRKATYASGQAIKKIDEALRLPPERAITELFGAINYLAAEIIVLQEGLE